MGAVVFALIGAAEEVRAQPRAAGVSNVARAPLAAVVAAVMGCAILGVGMGSAPAEGSPAPSAAAVTASGGRIATGGAEVRRGRRLFGEEGCDRCHSIAAIDARGKLGPRLDTLDEDLDDNLESIADPRDDIADGFSEKLMPADFGERLDATDLRALAAFVTAASGDEQEDEGGADSGRGGDGSGRGRGRGRSGED